MTNYKITDYSFKKAKENNVIIEPSNKKLYKIDIFTKTGDYITSIGNKNYMDFGTYLKFDGETIAEKRRKLYLLRHSKDISKIGSRGWWSAKILW